MTERCDWCSGEGQIECEACSGTGFVDHCNSCEYDRDCYNCNVEDSDCPECDGGGFLSCERCMGNGYVDDGFEINSDIEDDEEEWW